MAKQNRKQRVSVFFAYLFYLCAIGSIGATAWFIWKEGGMSPKVAAFSATIVFFVGAGIVLHVMGKANLPDLRLNR